MGYGLINGAVINGDDEDSPDKVANFAGMDLVQAGTAVAVLSFDAGSAQPLEIGYVATVMASGIAGVDLVRTDTHTALFEMILPFAGVDAVRAGTAAASVAASANSARPLEIGPIRAQNGVDVAATPEGFDIVRSGLHSALSGQPMPGVALSAASSSPLEIGSLTLVRGGMTYDAGSGKPLQLGALTTGVALYAATAKPLELGGADIATTVFAASARPIEIGPVSTRHSITVGGLALGRAGTASASAAGSVSNATSARPMEIGGMGDFGAILYARQSRPLQLGHIAVDRGTTC